MWRSKQLEMQKLFERQKREIRAYYAKREAKVIQKRDCIRAYYAKREAKVIQKRDCIRTVISARRDAKVIIYYQI
jgi:hypothetical protein